MEIRSGVYVVCPVCDFKIDIVFGDHKPLNEFSDYEWELLREHNPANYAAYQTDLLKRRSDYLYAIR